MENEGKMEKLDWTNQAWIVYYFFLEIHENSDDEVSPILQIDLSIQDFCLPPFLSCWGSPSGLNGAWTKENTKLEKLWLLMGLRTEHKAYKAEDEEE